MVYNLYHSHIIQSVFLPSDLHHTHGVQRELAPIGLQPLSSPQYPERALTNWCNLSIESIISRESILYSIESTVSRENPSTVAYAPHSHSSRKSPLTLVYSINHAHGNKRGPSISNIHSPSRPKYQEKTLVPVVYTSLCPRSHVQWFKLHQIHGIQRGPSHIGLHSLSRPLYPERVLA